MNINSEGKKENIYLIDKYLKTAREFNIDEIIHRIINGDSASWIKEGIDEEGVYFQLDSFHKIQAVIRNVEDKKRSE